MHCTECGNQLPETAKFCSECGTKVTAQPTESPDRDTRFCPQCRSPQWKISKFCSSCGTRLAASIERAARIATFDFSADIERLTRDFTGREWFFKEVDQWLAAETPRFMLLTANPGVGKSAIAARLTQVRADNLLAYHFCTARDSSTVVPNRIFRAIAAQLIDALPDYGEALANTIDAYRNEINVNIRVERMLGGKVVGVNIERLEASNPQEVLDILLRHPLQELNPPEQPQFVLIDSLDEAVTYSSGETLPRLLSKVDNLPNWVRFLCTSRPERRVLRYFDELEPYVLDAESQENLADTQQYITFRVVQPRLAARLHEAQLGSDSFSEHVASLAKGNFLYTQVLLDDIAAGHQPLDDLAALPQSLDEIYQQFLVRFTREEWRYHYRPIFSVLAVARQPIREDHLTQFTGINATDLRDDLGVVQQFLTEVRDNRERKVYTLFHQSIRDYLLDENRNEDFWCAPQDCHALITDYYLDKYRGRWTEAPDDGYLFGNLVLHLDTLADNDETAAADLATLFANQSWLNARFVQSHYQYDGYIADLMLAWDRSQAEALGQIETGQPPDALALCVRYALIRTSLNSLSANFEPVLVGRAVQVGLWLPERALSVAANIPDAQDRANLGMIVLGTGNLSQEQQHAVGKLALEAALAVSDESRGAGAPAVFPVNKRDRAGVLSALAPYLSGDSLQIAFEAALTISEERDRVETLSALAPHLSGETKERALQTGLETALTILDAGLRVMALSALVPYLSGESLQTALEAALTISDEELRAVTPAGFPVRDRVEILRDLAPYLGGESLQTALEAALTISVEWQRARALSTLAPHLSGETKERALQTTLEAAPTILDEGLRVMALGDLAPYLSGESLQTALEVALTISDAGWRAGALSTLAPYLNGETKERALQTAFEAALTISEEWRRAETLRDLAPYLSGDSLQTALEAALTISEERDRVETLSALAPYLSGETKERALQTALEAALTISEEWQRAGALSTLAPHLSGDSLQTALEAALTISFVSYRVETLRDLAPHLSGDSLQTALEAALTISDEWDREMTLGALAPHLSGDSLQTAFEAALTISDERDQVETLSVLAPYLSGETKERTLQTALEAALTISEEWQQAGALSTLAPHLSGETKERALQTAFETVLTISDAGWRAGAQGSLVPYWSVETLRDLAPHLSGDSLQTALEAALTISDAGWRAGALSALAPYLSGETKEHALQTAFEAALTISEEWQREMALESLAPHLSGETKERALQTALEAALTISEEWQRARALSALAPHLSGETKERALQTALEAALTISDARDREMALESLAPHLSGDSLQTTLEVALTISEEGQRVGVLSALAPHLSGDSLQTAFEAALTISDTGQRASTIVNFLPCLSDRPDLLTPIQQGVIAYLRDLQHKKRKLVLMFVAGIGIFTPTLNVSPETLAAIANHICEICTEWEWL